MAAIADIQAAIVNLRQYQPVIAVVAGSVGCFGGMSIAAGLCSYIVMTQEGRLGLNGPQVIEQEAGVQEYNAKIVHLYGVLLVVISASLVVWQMLMLTMIARKFVSKSSII